MNTPSAEQSAIVTYIRDGHNVLADCVAGSGKTTSVLLVASALRSKQILKVTYNKALKFEVRQKAAALELTNLEIHTYNSLCVKYYDREGYNNETPRLKTRPDLFSTHEAYGNFLNMREVHQCDCFSQCLPYQVL